MVAIATPESSEGEGDMCSLRLRFVAEADWSRGFTAGEAEDPFHDLGKIRAKVRDILRNGEKEEK